MLCNEIIIFGSENRNSLRVWCQTLKWDVCLHMNLEKRKASLWCDFMRYCSDIIEIVCVFFIFQTLAVELKMDSALGLEQMASQQVSKNHRSQSEDMKASDCTAELTAADRDGAATQKHRSVWLNSLEFECLTNRLSGRPSVSPRSPCKSQRRTCNNIYQGRKASFSNNKAGCQILRLSISWYIILSTTSLCVNEQDSLFFCSSSVHNDSQ